ncbi:MAG: SpoIIE family protein phosphatase [Thermoanaerobaculia bacterium]
MKVRTQLTLAFLLLAILPLGGIVLFSYLTSERAFKRAAEEEAGQLVTSIGTELDHLQAVLDERIDDLAPLPLESLAGPAIEEGPDPAETYLQLMDRLGEMADVVDFVELVPEQAPDDALLVYPSRTLEEALRKLAAQRDRYGEESGISAEYLAATVGEAVRRRGELDPEEIEALEKREDQSRRLLGTSLEESARHIDHGRVLLRVHVEPRALLERAFAGLERQEGDVPFALDAEGSLFVHEPGQRERLPDLAALFADDRELELTRRVSGDWLLVGTREPSSGLTFGIARPVRQSLREIRSTAVANFAFGVGMAALASLGILMLSGRMTRNLHALAVGTQRIASGDLTTRIQVRSRNEIGALAETMNRMALQLSRNQERLLEEERLRQRNEAERRLLAAENERKTRELEEARRLQLSLLPSQLPAHPRLELGVFMRTAAEVGGDYYDFFPGSDGVLTAALGDAAGHGARAATMVTVVKGLLTARAATMELPRLLEEASRSIKQMRLSRMHMAVSLLRTDGESLEISAAGIPPALLWRAATGAVEEVLLSGPPLGSLAGARYRSWSSRLAPGDTLLLTSDGFPELRNERDEMVGYPRLRDLFAEAAERSPDDLIRHLSDTADAWTAGAPPADDVTFLVLKAR